MKILMISRGWPTKNDPKWGCFEKDQAEALMSLGHEVKVLCLDCRFSLKPYIPKITRTNINGVDYISFRGLPQALMALLAGNRVAIKMEQWMVSKLYEKLLESGFRPEIAYSHFVLNSAAASILKEKFGLPLVVIEHSSELVKNKLSSIIETQARIAYNSANQIISVSDYLRNRIKDYFGIDSIVVPNMLGADFLKKPNIKKRSITERVKFLSVGALLPLKGYMELIEAFSMVDLPYDWELAIIGYGKLDNKLKRRVEQLGLTNHIKFLGARNKSEIIAEMATSDVFVLNTKKETFGVVYIEALSQGLPCIATKCGGAKGIVGLTDGINIEVGDQNALIGALKYMAEHHLEYDREDIRNRCLKRYAPTEVAKNIEIILQNNIRK